MEICSLVLIAISKVVARIRRDVISCRTHERRAVIVSWCSEGVIRASVAEIETKMEAFVRVFVTSL